MREELIAAGQVLAGIGKGAGLTPAEWAALPPAVRISHYLVDALILLDLAKEELSEERASPILSIEPDLDRAADLAYTLLKRLQA